MSADTITGIIRKNKGMYRHVLLFDKTSNLPKIKQVVKTTRLYAHEKNYD